MYKLINLLNNNFFSITIFRPHVSNENEDGG